MRKLTPVVVLVLALAGPSLAGAGEEMKVTGRSLATVYINGGLGKGLKVGDRVRVLKGQAAVAELEIVAINNHSAACRVVSLKRPVSRGDVVVPVVSSATRSAKATGADTGSARSAGVTKPTGTTVSRERPAGKRPPSPQPTVVASAQDLQTAPPPATKTPPTTKPSPSAASSNAPASGDGARTLASLGSAAPALTARDGAPMLETAVSKGSPPVEKPGPSEGPSETPAPSRPKTPPATKTPAVTEGSPAKTSRVPPGPNPGLASVRRQTAPPAPGRTTVPAARASTAPTAAVPTGSAEEVSGRGFRVKYRSAANAYLDGGRARGLDVGDRLRVVAGTSTVAELEVVYVAELSASCKVLSETRPVQAGDMARLVGGEGRRRVAEAGDSEEASPSASTLASTPAEPFSGFGTRVSDTPPEGPWARVRGAASFGYYQSWDRTESALDYHQRTARLDLGLYDIAGQPLSFSVRARSRQDVRARTLSVRTPRSERTDRLYEAALRYEPPSGRAAFEVGRIGIYRFVGLGYLDGALGRFRPRAGLQVGAFGGRLADVDGFGMASPGGKYGAFVRLAPDGRYVRGGYDVLLAYSRENAEGDVSREYFSLESSFGNGSRWSLFQRAELDLNRGWREEVSGKSYQLSNVSLSGNLRVTPSAWAFVSYDGRRNYRYYRNRLVPEEVFDDLLHQGLRAGVNVARPGGFGASAGFGMSLKEPDPRHPELNIANAYSFNGGIRHSNLFSTGISAGLNGSGFTNGYADGGLLTANLGWYLAGGHMLDLSYGHSLYHVEQTREDRTTRWVRFLGRWQLTRRFYVLGDLEYDAGDDLEGPRVFFELGALF